MPNIPSPISETSEDSFSLDVPPRKPAAPNFSRPQAARTQSHTRLHRDPSDRTQSHSINAFYEPNRDLPDEPRFSLDSEQTTSTSDNSAGSEFAWDGERGELRSKRRPHTFDQQRVSMDSHSRSRTPRGGESSGSSSRATQRQPPPPLEIPKPSSSTNKPIRPAVTKTVSFDQHVSKVGVSAQDQYEDSRSHHTVSDAGSSAGSLDMEGQWQSSDWDYSEFSEAEIRKLKKKGINPALYAEMKAAKKGRNKWMGALSGNTFLN